MHHNSKKRCRWEAVGAGWGADGCVCPALGVEEADAEEAAGLAGAPGLQFRGPPQLLHLTLGALAEDGDPRGELTLVHRVGE